MRRTGSGAAASSDGLAESMAGYKGRDRTAVKYTMQQLLRSLGGAEGVSSATGMDPRKAVLAYRRSREYADLKQRIREIESRGVAVSREQLAKMSGEAIMKWVSSLGRGRTNIYVDDGTRPLETSPEGYAGKASDQAGMAFEDRLKEILRGL